MSINSMKDPVANKTHDTVSTVGVVDPTGAVIRDLAEVRKQSVSDLVQLMQSSVNEHVSGMAFSSKFDLAYEPVYSLAAYAQSLIQAVEAILEAHPGMGDGDGSDDDLRYIIEICQAIITGTTRVREHLDAARAFATDLDNINMELQTQIQRLF